MSNYSSNSYFRSNSFWEVSAGWLAKIYDGVVINADAMQIYDVLSIITARPNIKSQDGVPHFLYGYVNPQIRYSVGEWQRYCKITGILGENKYFTNNCRWDRIIFFWVIR